MRSVNVWFFFPCHLRAKHSQPEKSPVSEKNPPCLAMGHNGELSSWYYRLCVIAVTTHSVLQYAKGLTPEAYRELCVVALNCNGSNLHYVDKQYIDLELCTIALRQNGSAIGCVQYFGAMLTLELYFELCLHAMQTDPHALQFIKDPQAKPKPNPWWWLRDHEEKKVSRA